MKKTEILKKLLILRDQRLGPRRFVILLSLITGLIAGLVAVFLKNLVHYTSQLITQGWFEDRVNFLYFALPLIGISLAVIYIKYFVKENISHGITRILFAISKQNSFLKPHNTYSSVIASTFTVGFGGSVGLEAPIVLTGSAIGSTISKFMRLNYRTTTLMLGCGAAGAIAGIFKAPIAAIIFALEVLMLDLTMWSLIPLMISAVTGATVSYFLLGKEVMFSFTLQDPVVLTNLPFYLILGLICGLVSVFITRGVKYIEGLFRGINNIYEKLIIGGIILGVLIFFFPPLYGEGYDTLKDLLSGQAYELTNNSVFYGWRDNYWELIGFAFLVLGFKIIAMAVTTGSGGIGGVFAPSLFMGGITGFAVSKIINGFDILKVSERNFTLIGMAGIMSGVMHAPLTAIFLIAELTGGYSLFIPLIVTATIAYLTVIYFEPNSLYTDRLIKRGELITHHKDKAVLTLLNLESVIEKDLIPVKSNATLGDLVKVISKSNRNIFPVIDEEGLLEGIILLDNVRDIIFTQNLYDKVKVSDLMIMPPAFVEPLEPMTSVMQKFEDTGAWNLPVADKGKYIGFISKARIFNMYRKLLVQFSDE